MTMGTPPPDSTSFREGLPGAPLVDQDLGLRRAHAEANAGTAPVSADRWKAWRASSRKPATARAAPSEEKALAEGAALAQDLAAATASASRPRKWERHVLLVVPVVQSLLVRDHRGVTSAPERSGRRRGYHRPPACAPREVTA